jgi:pyruvate dehydrogenase E1 component alpha subunit
MEFKTYRHGGHHVNDPGLYMPKDKLEAWKERDPVEVLKGYLLQEGVSSAKIEKINKKVEDLIEEAIVFATQSPEPSVEEFLTEIRDN